MAQVTSTKKDRAKIQTFFSIVGIVLLFSQATAAISNSPAPGIIKGDITVDGKPMFCMTVSYEKEEGLAKKTTRYFDTKGQLRLEENETFDPGSLDLVHFTLEDFKAGRREEFKKSRDKITIRYKKNKTTKFKEKTQDKYPHLLHGSMIALYLQKHIGKLSKNRKVSFRLLVPKYLTAYKFTVKKVKETRVNGKDCFLLKMVPSSIFLKPFVKSTYFCIQKDPPHHLMKYEGIITPKAGDGKSYRGIATFSYNR